LSGNNAGGDSVVNTLLPSDIAIPFASSYQRALVDYTRSGEGEEALMYAYELGRRAVAEQRNILDLVALHQNLVWHAVLRGVDEQRIDGCLRRSEEFLAEVLAPFEMMHRGFTDTIRQLQEVNATLEQRVAERTRELRESQRNTADLARLYQILSSINSAIVRLHVRDELFKEACRIAVIQGGYPVAWVNISDAAEPENTDTWCHLDRDGSTCQTSPAVSISVEIRNAIARVYAEGTPIVRHLGSDNPTTWNGFAAGYAAYGLLPLRLGGRVIGVFTLFSAEPDSFKPDEMRLLGEMAGDLSFSLEHIAKRDQLNYLAYYDVLTGLPNRTLLLERLPLQLRAAERAKTIVALLMVDLVHFSDINDTYGRHVGDSLLKLIGERFCTSVGTCETVARLNADRFALSLTNIGEMEQVAHLLEQQVFNSFSEPFRVGDTDIHVTVQVGISLFPSDAADADTLYKNAEIALKRAQSQGEPYLLYDAAMNERIIHSVTMQAKMRRAIELGELTVLYQPKVSTANGQILGLEALLRYIDPETGMVLPGRFIPLLEESGMIIEIGAWTMRRAAEDLRHWRRLNLNPPRVAVNVSPIQLRQKNFVTSLRQILRETDGRSDGLDVEITESAVMEEVTQNIAKLAAVREMGFHIAIDDFGTGYSSLSYLSRLPLNALKIDRSFIIDMTERPNSLAIVTAIISLAHSLDLQVVAEGVELEEQAKLLRLLRCDLIQGNLSSPPLPAEEIITLLGRNRL
jgi:diguanylate cyclase (GGDEF)-like protein